VTLIDETFGDAAVLDEATSRAIHRELAAQGVLGGAGYDGLVGAAARRHDLTLATRDARARGTYESVGVRVELLGS
jgi:predicted nucleic acid-binding protein